MRLKSDDEHFEQQFLFALLLRCAAHGKPVPKYLQERARAFAATYASRG
jgi:hypothetical protein